MASRGERSVSFGAQASAYDKGRPEYPTEAVAWMLEPVSGTGRRIRVADVGAGTGKLARAVTQSVTSQVVAVDPDPEMLAALNRALPGIPTFVGRGESLPLPDDSLDAALFGQAWHWVDAPAATAEAARVLRAGGVLGLIWNLRDESVDWVRRLTDIVGASDAERFVAEGGPIVQGEFGPLDEHTFAWTRMMTRDEVLAMARSRSHMITASHDERAQIETELAALLDEVGAIGEATVAMPYLTRTFRAVRTRTA